MPARIAIHGLLVALLCGCAKTAVVTSHSEAAEPRPVHTVCSILEPEAHFSDPHITVRGQFVQLAHSALLMDPACDRKALHLSYVSGGPHFLFCESEQLTRELGCPGGVNDPIVTVRGVLLPGRGSSPETGFLAIEEIVAYESTRTGRAVSP